LSILKEPFGISCSLLLETVQKSKKLSHSGVKDTRSKENICWWSHKSSSD
jgi:hypothetical protein